MRGGQAQRLAAAPFGCVLCQEQRVFDTGWYRRGVFWPAGRISRGRAQRCGHVLWQKQAFGGGVQWARPDGPFGFNGVSNLEFARFADAALQNRWTGLYHLCAAESVSKYAFLCHAKRVFSRETEVVQFDNPPIDRTLYCTRADVAYQQKPFVQMLEELNEWWAHLI